MFEKSLKIQEKLSGDKHPKIAARYDNLAYAYELQKRYAEAEKLYKKGIAVLKEIGGKKYIDIVRIYGNLAAMYEKKGEYQQVLLSNFKAYNICFLELGLNHEKTQKRYNMLKNTFYKWNPEGNFEQWLEEKIKELDED